MPLSNQDISNLVGSGLGALLGYTGSTGAASTLAGSAQSANDLVRNMFQTQQNNLQPWIGQGQMALSDLSSFMGLGGPTGVSGNATAPGVMGFKYNPANDPMYQFMLKSGSDAIANQRSALGGVNSGATLKALSDYGQQTAASSYQQEFNNWNTQLNNLFSRLSGLSGTGANVAGNVAGLGLNAANLMGSNVLGAGNAQAAGQVGGTNALVGGLQNIFSSGALNNLFSSGSDVVNTGGDLTGVDMSNAFAGFGSNPDYSSSIDSVIAG